MVKTIHLPCLNTLTMVLTNIVLLNLSLKMLRLILRISLIKLHLPRMVMIMIISLPDGEGIALLTEVKETINFTAMAVMIL